MKSQQGQVTDTVLEKKSLIQRKLSAHFSLLLTEQEIGIH